MGFQDEVQSISSASESSSSDDSETSSSEESFLDDEDVKELAAEDPCDNYWRQGVMGGVIVLGLTAIFATFIPILNQENDQFSATVGLPSMFRAFTSR